LFSTARSWIGNAPWYDLSIIWARDLADSQVKIHRRNKTTPGFGVRRSRTRSR
jgi:glutaryl-CoA dehydrogenase